MRFRFAALLLLALPLAAWAEPDINDTRLLTQPAVSANNIAFIYQEDLWVADLDGKNARRLTSDIGVESHPAFSPDGKTIAFSAQYDGNTDVYIIPVTGGAPKRLTWHPGADTVRGWTPDGKEVLFSSNRHVFTTRHNQLFTVPVTGGMPTQLPIPNAWEAEISPDGSKIAYCPHRDASSQWKHYRGGTHSRIWIFNNADNKIEEIPQPKDRCNDLDPNWVGNTILFRSDRNGEYNLFTYDLGSKAVAQQTEHKDFPVLDVAVGGGNIIYEQAGYLHLFNPADKKSTRLKIGAASDLTESRPRYAKGSRYVHGASVSPSGARAVFEFRGEIVTVPAEKGDPRNLTNSSGANERDPAWSPDGKTIAYFSDASGEYELHLAPQSGKGEVKKIKLEGSGFYQNLVWSRDSKKVSYQDNSQSLWWLDVETGKQTKIAEAKYGRAVRGNKPSSWSHDSKWLAYSLDDSAQIARVYVYSLEQNKSYPITDGLSEAVEPVFDAGGKYLYFLSSTDTGMSKHGFMQSAADSQRPRFALNLVVLRKDLPSPFLKESDEEKGEQPRPSGSGGGGDEPGAERPRPMAAGGQRNREPLKIDFEGIDQRTLAFPLANGNYSNLQAGSANQVYYVARAEATPGGGRGGQGGFGGGGALHHYDVERKRDDTIQPTVTTYELTPDGRKMLYATGPATWLIGSTTGGGAPTIASAAPTTGGGGRGRGRGAPPSGPAPAQPSTDGAGPRPLNLDAIEVRVDPQAEWKQIFHEAWRVNRDFFYDSHMHGADWPAMEKKYEQFLPHITSSADLYRVIGWMLSELAVGHSRYTPGERPFERKTVNGGLLGADYEIANGRYRFKKIYGGLNWTADLRSPLTAPGVNVKEGDYLLAVQGVDLKPPTELYSLFENTAGKSIEITVGSNADGKDSRTVTAEPLASEYALRNRDWIEGNLRKVEKATNGRVAYVYVPDTAMGGLTSFKRMFFPQIDKEAIIVDERSNSGGQIADYYIDILRRQPISHWAPRYGVDWRTPPAAIHGPKVMIIDEGAGSGGDMLPWMFRKFQLGPLVGKRTWGGLVGIGGAPQLMDGGTVTAPGFAIWTEDGFIVENEGVPPDVDVEQTPADVIAGKDPQLEKAIEIVMKELEKNPPKKDQKPPYPVRVQK
jgi:tricorn protease